MFPYLIRWHDFITNLTSIIVMKFLKVSIGGGDEKANRWSTGSTTVISYPDIKYCNYTNLPVATPTLSANPPVSATVYQNTNPYDIEIDLPVYATTAGTAGYVTVAKGASSTPTAIGNQYVSGDTSSTATQIIRLRVPAGWYYEFTGSGVTFATATPFAE